MRVPHFFIHSPVSGHLGCFHVLAVVNSAAMRIAVHVFFSFLVSSGDVPRSGIAGSSIQFSSVALLCPALWDPMNHSTAGLPVHQQLPEFTQTHVQCLGDAIQPSQPLLSPSPPAIIRSQQIKC